MGITFEQEKRIFIHLRYIAAFPDPAPRGSKKPTFNKNIFLTIQFIPIY